MGSVVPTSLFTLLLVNVFYIAAYFAMRISLTVQLEKMHDTLSQAYAISTGSAALFAIFALFWSIATPYFFRRETMISVGTAFNAAGLFLFASTQPTYQLFGIALFISGSSLFLPNFVYVINQLYRSDHGRQHGNHLRKLSLEAGAILGAGLLGFIAFHQGYRLLLITLAVSMLISCLISLRLVRWKMPTSTAAALPVVCVILSYLLLRETFVARYLLIFLFVVFTLGIVGFSVLKKKRNYLSMLLMLLLVNIVYWFSVCTLYNQISVVLAKHIQLSIFGVGLSPLSLMVFDPIAAFIVGAAITAIYLRRPFSVHIKLTLGLLCIVFSFAIMAYAFNGLRLTGHVSLSLIILAIAIYSISTFFISPTIISQVHHLLGDNEHRGLFIGMCGMTQAVMASVAFYFFRYTAMPAISGDPKMTLHLEVHLYAGVSIAALICVLLYWVCKFLGWIRV